MPTNVESAEISLAYRAAAAAWNIQGLPISIRFGYEVGEWSYKIRDECSECEDDEPATVELTKWINPMDNEATIYEATMYLNTAEYCFDTYCEQQIEGHPENPPGIDCTGRWYSLSYIVAHEIGHMLGFADADVAQCNQTVMYSEASCSNCTTKTTSYDAFAVARLYLGLTCEGDRPADADFTACSSPPCPSCPPSMVVDLYIEHVAGQTRLVASPSESAINHGQIIALVLQQWDGLTWVDASDVVLLEGNAPVMWECERGVYRVLGRASDGPWFAASESLGL